MVSKIPPVFNQQTASNISIENGVEVKGLKSCNLKLRQSSAFRGVRLRQQQKADALTPEKIEIISQKDPTIELNTFLREPPSYTSKSRVQGLAAKEVAAVYPSTWEENFQDLSGWCMASVQGRYNFAAGESAMTSKITELKSENSDVLTTTDMTSAASVQAIEEKINNDGETFVCAPELMSATNDVLPQFNSTNAVADQQQQINYHDNNIRNIINDVGEAKNRSDGWIGLSSKVESTMDANNDNITWTQLSNVGINTSTVELPLYYQESVIGVDAKQQEQQSQDLFTNFESVVSNDFDLLSYLCEGNNSSQGDSVSTDSSQDIKGLSKWTSSSVLTDILPKTYEPVTSSITTSSDDPSKSVLQRQEVSSHSQESPNSAISSTSSVPNSLHSQESPNSPISSTSSAPTIFSHSSSYHLRTIVKLEKSEKSGDKKQSVTPKHVVDINSNCNNTDMSRSKGRKRMLSNETESDDDGYRDTREKNNEASRKSRMNKKAKEQEMAKRAIELEKDNRVLKMKVEELEKLVSSMRNTLLRSALKKEIKDHIF